MKIGDEPIWKNRTQTYSEEIVAELRRVDRNERPCLHLFGMGWSFPSMIKEWVERI
jgi:NAD(P)H dehydrogenase (quinone)